MLGKGGLPDPSKMDPAALEAAAQMAKGGMPRGMTLPAGLAGLMKKK